jgi:hypothetical protein
MTEHAAHPTSGEAARELELVRAILDRTQRRLDPHAFHFVGWGAVVLVWYPLGNLFLLQGRPGWWHLALSGAALLAGILNGVLGEWRLARSGHAEPEDTVFSRQVGLIVWGTIGPAALLSFLGPAMHLFPGQQVPVVWGFAYAVLAYSMGVVYSREYLWAGIAIFAAAIAALALPEWSGFILGPAMGLGLLVPGLRTERRVRARGRAVAGA